MARSTLKLLGLGPSEIYPHCYATLEALTLVNLNIISKAT